MEEYPEQVLGVTLTELQVGMIIGLSSTFRHLHTDEDTARDANIMLPAVIKCKELRTITSKLHGLVQGLLNKTVLQ